MYRNYVNLLLLYVSKFVRPIQRLCKIMPIVANVKVTERCNCRCITCNMWKNKGNDELTTSEFIKIFRDLKQIGVNTLVITGGEPLLREDVDILIAKAKNIGFKKIILQTNGLLLSKKAHSLVEAGITDINVSIDGIGQIHDTMRGINGAYKKAVEGLYTIKNENPNIQLSIVTTLTKININSIPEIIKLCKKLNADWGVNLLDTQPYFFQEISIESLWPSKEDIDKAIEYMRYYSNLDNIIIDYIKNYYLGKNQNNFNCVLGYMYIYLDAKGYVYPGCWVFKPIGNVQNSDLKTLINSEKYRKRVLSMFLRNCPGCTCGYSTNVKFNKLLEYFISKLRTHTPI